MLSAALCATRRNVTRQLELPVEQPAMKASPSQTLLRRPLSDVRYVQLLEKDAAPCEPEMESNVTLQGAPEALR